MSSTAGVIALVAGIIVVIGLIAAFVVGARRKQQEPPPAPVRPAGARPADAPAPDADSWAAPPSTPGRAPQGGNPNDRP